MYMYMYVDLDYLVCCCGSRTISLACRIEKNREERGREYLTAMW